MSLPGRFQRLRSDPAVILDVAHNPQGAEVLARTLAGHPVPGRTLAVIAMMADKDVRTVIRHLAPQVDLWFSAGLPELPGPWMRRPCAPICGQSPGRR